MNPLYGFDASIWWPEQIPYNLRTDETKCEELEKAESHLVKFMQLKKTVPVEIHLALAEVFQMQSKFLEAEKYLNEALKYDPNNQNISIKMKTLSNLINSNTASDA